MKRILLLLLFFSFSAYSQITCTILDGASIFSGEFTPKYLGFIGSRFASDSVMNPFGNYGSQYSANSIRNNFGLYGGSFGIYSPTNRFSSSPPEIYKNGSFIGYLTTNTFLYPSVSLVDIDNSCTFYSSSLSNLSLNTPLITTPAEPFYFYVTEGLIDEISLYWGTLDSGVYFELYAGYSNSFEDSVFLGTTNLFNHTFADPEPGVTYYFWVFSCNILGCSPGTSDSGYSIDSSFSSSSTGTASGNVTSAQISGGAKIIGGSEFKSTLSVGDIISFNAEIMPESGHIGKEAIIFLFLEITNTGKIYYLSNNSLYPIEGIADTGLYSSHIQSLQSVNSLDFLTGLQLKSNHIGSYNFYISYAVEDIDEIFLNITPIMVTVNP